MKNSLLEILYVGTLPPHPGGSAIAGYQLLEGFAREGHGIRVIAPITPNTEDGFASSHPGIAVSRVIVPHFEMSPHFPYTKEFIAIEREAVERQMEELILQRRPDLIVIGRETYVRYVPELARVYNLPCLLIIHGGLTHGIIDGSHGAELAARLLSEYRKADAVVTPAEHMAGNLRKMGVDVSVIPNGVDLDLFFPDSDASKEIVVMYVGHLRPLKRPMDFVLGAEWALRKKPDLSFIVVGEGPAREWMEQLCRERGIARKFQFVGWVPHRKIPSYLNSASIIVTPTQIENQSLIHLEAQACGRVLVASDIPAAREIITDGETGLLFPLGDVEQLAAKVLQAATDAVLRKTIARNARASVQKHSMLQTVAAYIEAMQVVVQRHASRACL